MIRISATIAAIALALPAAAQTAGDPAKGEREFNKCKACHMIQTPEGEDIVKGGRTGPNLYGIVGDTPAGQEGFSYGDGILELVGMQPDMVWTEELLADYITDPAAFLKEQTGNDSAKTKMTFKMAKNQPDVVAFLAQHSPDAGAAAAPADAAAAPADAAAAPADAAAAPAASN